MGRRKGPKRLPLGSVIRVLVVLIKDQTSCVTDLVGRGGCILAGEAVLLPMVRVPNLGEIDPGTLNHSLGMDLTNDRRGEAKNVVWISVHSCREVAILADLLLHLRIFLGSLASQPGQEKVTHTRYTSNTEYVFRKLGGMSMAHPSSEVSGSSLDHADGCFLDHAKGAIDVPQTLGWRQRKKTTLAGRLVLCEDA
jgi:hypothetical protein